MAKFPGSLVSDTQANIAKISDEKAAKFFSVLLKKLFNGRLGLVGKTRHFRFWRLRQKGYYEDRRLKKIFSVPREDCMLVPSTVAVTSVRILLNSDLWYIHQQTGTESQRRESRVLLLLLYALVLRTTASGGSDQPTLWLSIGEDSLVRRVVSLVYQQKVPSKHTSGQKNVLLWFPYKQELLTKIPNGNQVIATNPTKPKADSGVAMFLQTSLEIAFPAEPKCVEFGEILELSRFSPDKETRKPWWGLQPRRAWASLFAQAEKLINDRICVGVGLAELRSYHDDLKNQLVNSQHL